MPIAVNRRGIVFLEVHRIPESELEAGTYTPLLFSFIVIRHEGRFLLVYHRRRKAWELPGGHIEEGESARDCAVRELREETGQSVDALDFNAALEFHDTHRSLTFFSAMYSGFVASPAPFRGNDEISRTVFWDGRTDIGYVDEIDAAVAGLLLDGSV